MTIPRDDRVSDGCGLKVGPGADPPATRAIGDTKTHFESDLAVLDEAQGKTWHVRLPKQPRRLANQRLVHDGLNLSWMVLTCPTGVLSVADPAHAS